MNKTKIQVHSVMRSMCYTKYPYVIAEGSNFSVSYKFSQYSIKYPIPDNEGLKNVLGGQFLALH